MKRRDLLLGMGVASLASPMLLPAARGGECEDTPGVSGEREMVKTPVYHIID